MKLHERTMLVREAELEISKALSKLADKYELTYGEYVKILAAEMLNLSKYMIREERHPDNPGKKGDEA